MDWKTFNLIKKSLLKNPEDWVFNGKEGLGIHDTAINEKLDIKITGSTFPDVYYKGTAMDLGVLQAVFFLPRALIKARGLQIKKRMG